MTPRIKKHIRRSTAVVALAGAAVLAGGGAAQAYPPTPTIPTDDQTVPTAVSPESPAEESEGTTPSGTLPQTGGPGTTQILLIAGAAVVAGAAITGVARSRRDDEFVTA
ncbi:MAG: LPXTG cell wall anchor domain-containing protein [Ilumatobacter sp.]